jgi:peptidoglycan/LPS O-acetylase OafA/YrhL
MRIESLTFLRFAAAVVVLFFHYGQQTWLVSVASPFIISGPPMVTFFFTLSGFVMLVSHIHKPHDLRRFYVSRAARIFPIYYVALFLTASLVLGYGLNDKYSYLLSLFFLQSWIPPYPTAMNTPAWSLSVEVFFYLSFPLMLHLIRKYQPRTSHLIVLSLVVYLVSQVLLSQLLLPPISQDNPALAHDLLNYFPLSHLCSFLMGMTGGVIYVRNQQRFGQRGTRSYIVLLAASALVYFLLQHPAFLQNLLGVPLAYASSFYTWLALLLILSVAYADNAITRFLASKPMVFCGDISLSVYILQKPIHILYRDYLEAQLGLGPDGNFYAYCALLIAISCCTYLVIEKRGSKLVFQVDATLSAWMAKKAYA